MQKQAVHEPSTGSVDIHASDDHWADFWSAIAASWAKLPPEIQQEYADRYPASSSGAQTDFSPACEDSTGS